jgi:predicted nucleic acid-binding protein
VLVADASSVLELLLRTPAAARVAARLLDAKETVQVPHLLDVEVAQALRRYVLARALSPAEGAQALHELAALPLQRHAHLLLLERAFALRASVTVYDGIYVALAEALACPLVTRDGKLARAQGHRARIELL